MKQAERTGGAGRKTSLQLSLANPKDCDFTAKWKNKIQTYNDNTNETSFSCFHFRSRWLHICDLADSHFALTYRASMSHLLYVSLCLPSYIQKKPSTFHTLPFLFCSVSHLACTPEHNEYWTTEPTAQSCLYLTVDSVFTLGSSCCNRLSPSLDQHVYYVWYVYTKRSRFSY